MEDSVRQATGQATTNFKPNKAMKTSKITILILAAAVIVLAVALILQRRTPAIQTGSPIEVIMTRSSVRSYTDKPVAKESVETLLRAAMAAPSAVNKQPWAFVVVDDRALLSSLAEALPNTKMAAEAQLAIVVCGDMRKTLEGEAALFWVQDCSAATENLLLAAHAQGLGAVWTGIYPNAARADAVRSILGLPSYIVPLNVIPVGYPASENTPKDKWKPENIHTNGWQAEAE